MCGAGLIVDCDGRCREKMVLDSTLRSLIQPYRYIEAEDNEDIMETRTYERIWNSDACV